MPAIQPPLPPGLPRHLQVQPVELSRPLQWLRRGWGDLWRCPGPGLAHGLLASLFGLVLVLSAHDLFWVMAGAFSGFLIVAPIVATGLYAVSRNLEQGKQTSMRDILSLWRGHDPRLVHFGVLLGLAGTGWVITSASMITSFSELPVQRPLDFLRFVVLQESGWLFEAWLMLGAFLAAPMFASSVVAIPLLLDRQVDVLTAVLTSWRVVMASPGTMALWAGLIMGISMLGMATLLLGMVVAVPWLAHASWHAYRDLVKSADEPPAAAGAA